MKLCKTMCENHFNSIVRTNVKIKIIFTISKHFIYSELKTFILYFNLLSEID
jgi:hypothetical protein